MDNDIIERAKEYADRHKATEINYFGVGKVYGYERIYNAELIAYERGAKEQKAIDDVLCKSGEASDGYHTFNELYDFRREYNAALVNSGVWKAHKSYRHHSGELCFGGGWFIVMIETPFGQISNHYENKYWDEFHCEEKEFADKWDGHTEKDVIARLMMCNMQKQ